MPASSETPKLWLLEELLAILGEPIHSDSGIPAKVEVIADHVETVEGVDLREWHCGEAVWERCLAMDIATMPGIESTTLNISPPRSWWVMRACSKHASFFR